MTPSHTLHTLQTWLLRYRTVHAGVALHGNLCSLLPLTIQQAERGRARAREMPSRMKMERNTAGRGGTMALRGEQSLVVRASAVEAE